MNFVEIHLIGHDQRIHVLRLTRGKERIARYRRERPLRGLRPQNQIPEQIGIGHGIPRHHDARLLVLRRAQIRGHGQVRARRLYSDQSYRRAPGIAGWIDSRDQIDVQHACFEFVRIDKKGLTARHGPKLNENICQFFGYVPQIIEVDAQL